MEEDWKIPLIGLSYVDFLSPWEKKKIIKILKSPARIFECSLQDLCALTQRRLRTRMWNPTEILDQAERTEKLLTPGVMGCIFYWDSTYPSQLRTIYDPPVTLFFRGTLPENGCLLAGIVGTRFPSGGARKAAFGLGFELGRHGIGVVSGLAKGVDREAHEGCVMAGGYSIAVLGSGVDLVYPTSSAAVGRALLEAGGAILSEYPPGALPLQFHFPARNRIINGLSRAVVVVQAPEHSGALITATYAAEEGRDVYVHSAGIPGTVGTGTRRLAEQGATVISGARDLMRDWGLEYKPASGQAARPGETTGQALARVMKGEMEGACATK
ncbi:MAG TPA: DNA-processing protein DprA, partial [Spirochaetia bacterium]|nr:DNA-processing protein DprA [Spirochaetia bacterium]